VILTDFYSGAVVLDLLPANLFDFDMICILDYDLSSGQAPELQGKLLKRKNTAAVSRWKQGESCDALIS